MSAVSHTVVGGGGGGDCGGRDDMVVVVVVVVVCVYRSQCLYIVQVCRCRSVPNRQITAGTLIQQQQQQSIHWIGLCVLHQIPPGVAGIWLSHHRSGADGSILP